MKAKIYVVLEDYDNGEDYEDRVVSYREFIDIAGTINEARMKIQDLVSKILHDSKGFKLVPSEEGEENCTEIRRPSKYSSSEQDDETITFYIEEKEVEISD